MPGQAAVELNDEVLEARGEATLVAAPSKPFLRNYVQKNPVLLLNVLTARVQ